MNSILILKEELLSPNEARLSGKRAQYFRDTHALPVGAVVRCGIWNEASGHAEILSSEDGVVLLSLQLSERQISAPRIELIVSVPRPQTVKKILALSAMMGVEKLHFVRTEGTEKSYLISKSLEKDLIQEELIKGLEQACSTKAPEVYIHPRFKPFIEEIIPASKLANAVGIIADTKARPNLTIGSVKIDRAQPAILAIGPESGWNDFEREQFKNLGFEAVSLGPRQLRVEVAAAVMLGQIELIRGFSRTSQ